MTGSQDYFYTMTIFMSKLFRPLSNPVLVDCVPLHPEVDGSQGGVQVLVPDLANVGKFLIQRGEELNKQNFHQQNFLLLRNHN